jgi:hypothetical protein
VGKRHSRIIGLIENHRHAAYCRHVAGPPAAAHPSKKAAMSASDLIDRLERMSPDQPLTWREIRDEIQREADTPNTPEERVLLLLLFNRTLDQAEREVAPEKLDELRKVRAADYKLLIMKEAMVGEHVCADTLYEITGREIEAGRMAPEDGLRQLATKRVSEPHPSRAEMVALAAKKTRRGGLFRRLFQREPN